MQAFIFCTSRESCLLAHFRIRWCILQSHQNGTLEQPWQRLSLTFQNIPIRLPLISCLKPSQNRTRQHYCTRYELAERRVSSNVHIERSSACLCICGIYTEIYFMQQYFPNNNYYIQIQGETLQGQVCRVVFLTLKDRSVSSGSCVRGRILWTSDIDEPIAGWAYWAGEEQAGPWPVPLCCTISPGWQAVTD